MNIDEILDLMDGLLDKSSSVPFSNKRMIDCEQMREYIDTIRLNFPTELKKAKDMARDKDKIIAEANKNAEEIIKKAEERAKILVSEQEIIKEAGEIANDQLKRAKEQADQIIADAVAKDRDIKSALASNLNKVLSDAERVLNRNLNEVTTIKEAIIRIGSAE